MKFVLKLNIQKTKIMASSPIPSWRIQGEMMETMPGFIFLGSRITADDDCSHEMKRLLLLLKKSYDKQSIKKQRHYFANKGPSGQNYGFSSSHVWMWASLKAQLRICLQCRRPGFSYWVGRSLGEGNGDPLQ